MTETCACGAPTPDTATMCPTCNDHLARLIGDVPAMVDDLEVTMTGQRAKVAGSSGGGAGIHWNEAAGDTLRTLRKELAADVQTCIKDHVRTQSPTDTTPNPHDPKAMSRWLLWRVAGLAYHADGHPMLTRLTTIEQATARIIDNRAPNQYLGRCTSMRDGVECGGSIYAPAGKETGTCERRDCKAEYDVEASRAGLEDALDARLYTAAEIASLSVYLGLPVSRERVRKLLNQWHRRGRIVPHGTDTNGAPMFTYGDVRALLYKEATG